MNVTETHVYMGPHVPILKAASIVCVHRAELDRCVKRVSKKRHPVPPQPTTYMNAGDGFVTVLPDIVLIM